MGKEIEHEWTDKAVCPYCGYEHENDGDPPMSGKCQCYSCEKFFFCEPSYSVDYTTAQVPCWNGTPHKMKMAVGWPDDTEKTPWNCTICRDHTEWRDREPPAPQTKGDE